MHCRLSTIVDIKQHISSIKTNIYIGSSVTPSINRQQQSNFAKASSCKIKEGRSKCPWAMQLHP